MSAPDDDVRSAAALREPYAFLRRLREHDPVHWSESSGAWILSGHAAVLDAFKDVRLSSDRLKPLEARLAPAARLAMKPTFELLRGWMVFRDGADHAGLRDPVKRVFTPRRVAALVPRIEAIVDEHLAAMAGSETVDLKAALAFPLPAIVIAELLGVPAEDRGRFQAWSSKLSGLVFGAVERSDRAAEAREGAEEFARYFRALVRRAETAPGDDLLSALVAARDRGDSLTPGQLVGACTMLLFGGHETTANLILNGVAALLSHPGQLARLRAEPALVERAVEELLRFEGPAKMMVRVVAETHERGGHRLAAGERVYLAIAGANRDPDVFADPDRLDVGRDPNPHLGFGHGLHYCLGAALARVETRIALGRLLARFPGLALAEPPRWGSTLIGRGLPGLALRLGPPAR